MHTLITAIATIKADIIEEIVNFTIATLHHDHSGMIQAALRIIFHTIDN